MRPGDIDHEAPTFITLMQKNGDPERLRTPRMVIGRAGHENPALPPGHPAGNKAVPPHHIRGWSQLE